MASSAPQPPIPNPFQGPSFPDLFSLIPGGDTLKSMLAVVQEVIGDVEKTVEVVTGLHPYNLLVDIVKFLSNWPSYIRFALGPTWQNIADWTTGDIIKSFLIGGLEVDWTSLDDQAKASVSTIDTVLGFGLLLNFLSGALSGAGEAIATNRWGKGIHEAIRTIPEEMGLTWALGLTIEKLFEAAMGEAVVESIRKKKRPNQPEWPIVRTMLRQHLADPVFLRERLESAGYPDATIENLMKLADAQLNLADIQQLYLHGEFQVGETLAHIKALGYNDEQAALLQKLYVERAETVASRTYVSTARQLFRSYLMTEADYRALLTSLNYPTIEIDDDVAAVTLEHQTGRLQNSAATIKANYSHGILDDAHAAQELELLGYGPAQANELVATWKLGSLVRRHGLSQAKILSYFVSGLLTADQAMAKLKAAGLDDADIAFVIQHPTVPAHVRVRPLTPSLVTSAYLDGAIQQPDLPGLFAKSGVDPAYVPYYEQMALFRKARQRSPGSGNAPLSHGEIVDAWAYGIVDELTAIGMLEQLGYSEQNAELLLELKNKGPIRPAGTPAFPSVADAINYLLGSGFIVYAPPDPLIGAAEQIVAQAGYSWQAPTTPPVPITGPPNQLPPPVVPPITPPPPIGVLPPGSPGAPGGPPLPPPPPPPA